LLIVNPQTKFLLICRTQAKVLAIEEALRVRAGLDVARFHEGMGLLQRDRNAAWFAEPDGARLMLCSEIGSEGRNFQFAHHLVLWDLPRDPDLLEQRIGRLDRIGQSHDVVIHLPLVEGSPQHVLARWYHEGVNAFRASPADARALLRQFGDTLAAIAIEHGRLENDRDQALDALISETRAEHAALAARMEAGRDRLLELAASREPAAGTLERDLHASDADATTHDFIARLLDGFGVTLETAGSESVLLDPQYLITDALPGLGEDPREATFSRSLALAREELPLLRLDHPMITAAMELLLSSETGNATFMIDDALPARSALLQTVFVLECVADQRLDAARFLPPTPVIANVDSRLATREGFTPSARGVERARERHFDMDRYRKILARLVPSMLQKAEQVANNEAAGITRAALAEAHAHLDPERERLKALATINPSVRESDISAIDEELAALERELPQARLRLDAVRFVASADFLRLR
jgi:ATP-dependent helicase HepA